MLSICALDDSTIEAAGALVAHEHTWARRLHPGLPEIYTRAAVCTSALQQLRATGSTGAVAFDDGCALAVMTLVVRAGRVYGRHARLPAEGFAVAPTCEDPTTVLARLYAELAPQVVAGGVRQFFVDHIALPPLAEGLANLGFGRHHVYAVQPAAPRPSATHVQVRIGGRDDLATIARLAFVEFRHRSTPPIYAPTVHLTLEEILEAHRTLQSHGATHFIAAIDGDDVGLLTLELTSPAPRLCAAGQPYIGPTATHPDARGKGVAGALVDAALTWGHGHGYAWVAVDFEPANPLSRPFWLGRGFAPLGYSALRSIHASHQSPH
ncbi:MAG: GNAT family N-acetyltransferase [Chloroflexi bacterium]|nr:GNAT family N-acetyltransferase [Chloroflexota bacterium]